MQKVLESHGILKLQNNTNPVAGVVLFSSLLRILGMGLSYSYYCVYHLSEEVGSYFAILCLNVTPECYGLSLLGSLHFKITSCVQYV